MVDAAAPHPRRRGVDQTGIRRARLGAANPLLVLRTHFLAPEPHQRPTPHPRLLALQVQQDPQQLEIAMVEPLRGAGAPGIAVSVRDQGAGIAPELAPRVFRQFWRAKRRGGAGLGLFIVKGLVEAHGGTISVHQAPGGGAEFRFTMPAGTPEFG